MKNIELPEALIVASSELFEPEDQINQMLEELGELIVAVNHMRRGRVTVSSVMEEMADVVLTITQVIAALSKVHNADYEVEFREMLLLKSQKLRSKLLAVTSQHSDQV